MSTYDPLDTTDPAYDGPLIPDYPFQNTGDPAHVVATQPYYVQALSYAPADLDDTISAFGDTLQCVGDYDISKAEAGGVTFNRKWANVPEDITTPTSVAYTFPALLGQRASFTLTVPAITLDEYFLVGAGETYATFDAIPIIQETQATFTSGGPYPLSAGNFFLNNGGTGVDTSAPSATAYIALIATDAATPASYSIVVKASEVERYLGNIFRRRTLKCKAN